MAVDIGKNIRDATLEGRHQEIGRLIMITMEPPEWMKDDQNKNNYCKSCARLAFKKPVYIMSGSYVDELCFCNDCWNEILEKIGMKINETRT